MNNPKVKLLLLISLLAALGAVLSSFATGSHFQMGFNDGAFNYDIKVATASSGAATVLGVIALAAGLVGVGLHVSRGCQAGGEADRLENRCQERVHSGRKDGRRLRGAHENPGYR